MRRFIHRKIIVTVGFDNLFLYLSYIVIFHKIYRLVCRVLGPQNPQNEIFQKQQKTQLKLASHQRNLSFRSKKTNKFLSIYSGNRLNNE